MSADQTAARKLQKHTGARYTTCLHTIRNLKREAEAYKEQHPEVSFSDALFEVGKHYIKPMSPPAT